MTDAAETAMYGGRLPRDPRDAALVRAALRLTDRCAVSGDVPVGALVVTSDGTIVGQGWNVRESRCDPTGHAEVVALRDAAARLGTWRLDGCALVVTLEPCPMCAGALVLARVARVVFGAWDEKAGACGSVWDLPRDRHVNHRVEVVGGVEQEACAEALRVFFAGHR